MGSMGADIADINNDLLPDVFVTEMLPEKLDRYIAKTAFDSYDKTKLNQAKGYHNQYGRNVLNINQGIRNGIPHFIELARYHNMEATDWSWGALAADYDLNGQKDLFIANGIFKDLLDKDHIDFYSPSKIGSMLKEKKENVIMSLMDDFPSEPLDNYLFLQNDKGEFSKLDFSLICSPGFSNGSAYADLDNDGDLDLVVNNISKPASIFRNNSLNSHNYIKFNLSEKGMNRYAIGSKITLFSNGETQMLELKQSKFLPSLKLLRSRLPC